MTDSEVHKTIRSITEYQGLYKKVNHYILILYSGLDGQIAKVSSMLFALFIKNKIYSRGDAEDDSVHENKRIYTNIELTPEIIADETNITSGPENIQRILKRIHDENIFYRWIYSGKYIFFMERDYSLWKPYNSLAYVVPRTINKILRDYEEPIKRMIRFQGGQNNIRITEQVNISFCKFIDSLIDKMNPIIAHNVTRWNSEMTPPVYIKRLKKDINTLGSDDGYLQADDFYNKLPRSVREKVCSKIIGGIDVNSKREKKESKEIKRKSKLIDEIIPANPSLVKKKRVGTKKTKTKINRNKKQDGKPRSLDFNDNVIIQPRNLTRVKS